MSATQAPREPPELSEEEHRQMKEMIQQREELKENAPRYDVEYHVLVDDVSPTAPSREADAVMTALGRLEDDLEDHPFVEVNISVGTEQHESEQIFTVTIVVASEVQKSEFDWADAVYTVDAGNKHYLWCVKDFEMKDTRETIIDPAEVTDFDYPVAEWEMEFLRE